MKASYLDRLGIGIEELASTPWPPIFASSQKKVVLEPVQRAPSRRDVEKWQEEQRQVCEGVETKENDDECHGEELVEKSQLVIRVRQNSEDSMGSEISCSPPSSPVKGIRSVTLIFLPFKCSNVL